MESRLWMPLLHRAIDWPLWFSNLVNLLWYSLEFQNFRNFLAVKLFEEKDHSQRLIWTGDLAGKNGSLTVEVFDTFYQKGNKSLPVKRTHCHAVARCFCVATYRADHFMDFENILLVEFCLANRYCLLTSLRCQADVRRMSSQYRGWWFIAFGANAINNTIRPHWHRRIDH